jgi:hypothetical protein
VEKGQDAKIRKKFVFAYLVDPNASGDRLDYARKQAEEQATEVPDMNEMDEVIRLEKLLVDIGRKEMFF